MTADAQRTFVGYDLKQVGGLSWRCEMIEAYSGPCSEARIRGFEHTYAVVHGLTRGHALRRARRIMRRRWKKFDRSERTAERVPA